MNIGAQPMGWPTARGPSRPPMWGLGGQPEDVFEDVLEDVLERLLTMSIGYPRRSLDIHVVAEYLWISMGIPTWKFDDFHSIELTGQMMF